MTRYFSQFLKPIRKLVPDGRGAAAIEFALILPVMLMLYLGSSQLAQAFSIYRLVALTASTVTNVVTQYSTISSSATMPDILNASVQVLNPYDATKAKIVVSAVSIDAKGKATVTWSQTLHGTQRPVGQVITLPTELNIPSTMIILGETTYSYISPVDFLKIGTINLSSSIYMVPRAATVINLTS
jgi:Flp pilus assembly protein TadG